jgi:hypothetical protein
MHFVAKVLTLSLWLPLNAQKLVVISGDKRRSWVVFFARLQSESLWLIKVFF